MADKYEIGQEVVVTTGSKSRRGKVVGYSRETITDAFSLNATALDLPDQVSILPVDPISRFAGQTKSFLDVCLSNEDGSQSRIMITSRTGNFNHVHPIIDVEPTN